MLFLKSRNYSNLDKEERKAIKNLKGYKDIVIKNADKGSAVIVWGIEQYWREAYKQLGESSVYELVQNNPVESVCKRVDEKLEFLKNKGSISGDNLNYLSNNEGKLGRFYLFPKINKRLIDATGRPVISNCGTATEKL